MSIDVMRDIDYIQQKKEDETRSSLHLSDEPTDRASRSRCGGSGKLDQSALRLQTGHLMIFRREHFGGAHVPGGND